MTIDKVWNQYELFFYHEFINVDEFDKEKLTELQVDSNTYFRNNDFTIYQEKTLPVNQITKGDLKKNYGTFIRILYHLPLYKVEEFVEFHYSKYENEKKRFIDFLYSQLKDSRLMQGGKEIPPPSQKLRAIEWCENKYDEISHNIKKSKPMYDKEFINLGRISELKSSTTTLFDLKKLIRMLEEINYNYSNCNYLSVAMIGRAIIDHIPPIFGFQTFNEVANNYGNKSFKKNMAHLNLSMRSIADSYLHVTIRQKEMLPNINQIDFSRELDFLLAEMIRIIR